MQRDHEIMASAPPSPYIRNLTAVALAGLSQNDAAFCHLSRVGWETLKDCIVYTTLDWIEMEMRQSRGLASTGTYAPLLAAFSILDQLGRAYLDRGKKRHQASGAAIHHALYYFCGYAPMSPEVKALYALRNGLVHAASLTSMDQASGARYIFRFSDDIDLPIVLSSTAWDGQLSTIGSQTTTLINSRLFTDQVSGAINEARELFFHRSQDMKILLTKGQIICDHLTWKKTPPAPIRPVAARVT
jgi:hypothetical protein